MNGALNNKQSAKPFQQAKWIWHKEKYEADEYAVFQSEFDFQGGNAVFRICVETNYVAYLNGKMIAYGRFAGYSRR